MEGREEVDGEGMEVDGEEMEMGANEMVRKNKGKK